MPLSPAEKQRRYRKRDAREEKVYSVPVKRQVIEALIDAGFVTEAQADSKAHLEIELVALIEMAASVLQKNRYR